MKKISAVILVFVLCFAFALGFNSIFKEVIKTSTLSGNNSTNLVIDAGHGGMDAGTIGIDGAAEKGINLTIAKKLYDFASVSGINCFLVRDGDYLVYNAGDDKKRSDLYNRMDFINSIPNANLISIHQNHFENEREWGTQIWYSPNDNVSKSLADSILNIAKDNLQKDNKRENKVSDNSYYLLYKAKVPSVMVECGFMSNAEENSKLQDNTYQNCMAYSIMLGYSDFISEEL